MDKLLNPTSFTGNAISAKKRSSIESKFYTNWKFLSLFNLLLVATAGVLLRAKILFPIPWIDHKFLLHAHSHFAFSGWLGQILSVAIVELLSRSGVEVDLKKVRLLFILNALASYGMLFTFPFMGYAGPSIFFSVLSLVYSIWFSMIATRYVNRSTLSALVKNCFRLGFATLLLSSIGPITLAVGKAMKIESMELEVKSVYWFLHFQYNGFFLFSIFGLYVATFSNYWQKATLLRQAFTLFAISVIPSYLLSIQWLQLSTSMQLLASVSGALQIVALALVTRYLLLNKVRRSEWIWIIAFIAFALKIIFQFVSIFPSIGKIAFGFRPIVIGYLHLVLLGMMTTFILGYLNKMDHSWKPAAWRGVIIFVLAIVLNELALFCQGLFGILGIYIRSINLILFVISLLLLLGISLTTLRYKRETLT